MLVKSAPGGHHLIVGSHYGTSGNGLHMMTSSGGNVFRVTGPFSSGEFTAHQWIPLTKASGAEFGVFFICA